MDGTDAGDKHQVALPLELWHQILEVADELETVDRLAVALSSAAPARSPSPQLRTIVCWATRQASDKVRTCQVSPECSLLTLRTGYTPQHIPTTALSALMAKRLK